VTVGHFITITVGTLAVSTWCYLVFARGGFWLLRNPEPVGSGDVPSYAIAVIVPARNEAEVVHRAIESLLAQDYRAPVQIFLVDDESSDGTAEVARKAAERVGKGKKLTVLRAAKRPPGWTGKLWAIAEGIREARSFPAEYYLLTDADVVHAAENLRELVARAQSDQCDLVSLMVRLRCRSWAERALIPAFVFFFFMLYPPSWVRSMHRKAAAAAGGCILIRRASLDAIGGVAAIRGELIDDCALARAVKGTGRRIWLGVTRRTRSIRDYHSWSEVRGMISRNAFTQLRHSFLLLGLTCIGMFITFVVPCILAFMGGGASIFGTMAWVLMSVAYMPTLRYYRRSLGWAAFLPAVGLFYMGATVDSAVAYWRGKGGVWKGRVQDVGSSRA
jgi:hopene-associated glycosyltransferase HpnB